MQKFLVIQTAFIGDVVLATALIEKLHAFFPDARIDFLVRKGNEALLAGHPWLHAVLVWDKKKGKLKNLWAMGGRIRREKYDKVLNVQRFAATGLLTAFSGAKETIGFDKNPLSRWFSKRVPHIVSVPERAGEERAGAAVAPSGVSAPLHEVERNQLLIRDFTDDVSAKPRLYPTTADEEKVSPFKVEKYITMSPASVWFTKQYPKEKWVEFLRVLPAEYTVYLLGGPSDKELCQQIVAESGRGKDLSGMLSFLQSAALMKGAAMNYVNDSAPMHFASAVNAPVTAVYCSTIPGFGFGPLSDIKFIVEIKEPLDCRPCGLHGYKACPRGHFNCAYKIEEAQLLQTLINSRFNGH
ncbi:MAG TPA: glycosyltransferase family 9 protein [Puia sp.]|nr:glycosyltransferase family 9 protein [Puia sp.]